MDHRQFCSAKSTRDNAFNIEVTGDWAKDNRIGRDAALDLAAYVKSTGDMPMVGLVLERVYSSNHGEQNGVKAGFTCAIAALLSR